jgi:nitrogen fixation NifU-like protein
MDTELKELYQEIILDHNKNPKNFRKLEPANYSAQGYNPLCGDKIDIFLNVEDDIVTDVSFQGAGCAISKASASMMTTILKNKTLAEAKTLFENFKNLITGETKPDIARLGKMAVFAGVREYPVRAKCATLAWHTMMAALERKSENEVVSTE